MDSGPVELPAASGRAVDEEGDASGLVAPGTWRSDGGSTGRAGGQSSRRSSSSYREGRNSSRVHPRTVSVDVSSDFGSEVTDFSSARSHGEEEKGKKAVRINAPITITTAPTRSTLSLLFIQTVTLLWRNSISLRRWQSTLLLLIAPALLVLIIAGIDKGVSENLKNSNVVNDFGESNRFDNVRVAEPVPVGSIPLCSASRYIAEDGRDGDGVDEEQEGTNETASCLTLAYSPLDDVAVESIVQGIMQKNDPEIPPSQVRGFASVDEVNAYLLQHPRRVLAAVHFETVASAEDELLEVDYTLQTNSSVFWYKGQYENPNTYVQVPVQVAVERQIVTMLTQEGAAGVGIAASEPSEWKASLSQFPHPPADYVPSIAGAIAPTFLLAAAMVAFVIQLAEVVDEKHSMLRAMLRHAGMKDPALWTSWIIWFGCWSVVIAACMLATSLIVDLSLVVENSVALFYTLVLCFLLSMSSLALLIGSILSDPASATATGFIVFLIAWIVQLVVIFGFPFEAAYPVGAQAVFAVQPWAIMAKALQDLDAAAAASGGRGMMTITWSTRYSYCVDETAAEAGGRFVDSEQFYMSECVMPVGTVIDILAGTSLVLVVLAIYVEAAVRMRHPLYFVLPAYWSSRGSGRPSFDAAVRSIDDSSMRVEERNGGDKGAIEEEEHLRAAVHEYVNGSGDISDRLPCVAAMGIVKDYTAPETFFGATARLLGNIFRTAMCCFTRGRGTSLWVPRAQTRVLQGVWLGMPRDQVTCLLGPNGAGKTTLISILSGDHAQTSGATHFFGLNYASAQDRTGICPQFDALMGHLTATEHCILYARMRGMRAHDARVQTAKLLQSLNLIAPPPCSADDSAPTLSWWSRFRSLFAYKTIATFSGGMKRRLSVALALLGDPLVVIFDEPTTGIDPASRRCVWDVIHEAKRGRSVLVTTHSMEEAEVLADKVAILVRGRVRAIGSTLALKTRYVDSKFTLHVSLVQPQTFMLPQWRMNKMRKDVSDIVQRHIGGDILQSSEDERTQARTYGRSARGAGDEFDILYDDSCDPAEEKDDDNATDSDSETDTHEGALDGTMPFSGRSQISRRGTRSMRQALFSSSRRCESIDDSSIQNRSSATVSFSVGAMASSRLANLFEELESRTKELGISQLHLTLASLEDVFINVVQRVEVGLAERQGRKELVHIHGRPVWVPMGAEFVAMPPAVDDALFDADATARSRPLELWKLKWAQDDYGMLHMVGATTTGESIVPRERRT